MSKKALPIDVLPLLLELYEAALKDGYPANYPKPIPSCRCRMCRIVRKLKRVMPPLREGDGK
jgi:hypothetical protein